MFTGIVEEVGLLTKISQRDSGEKILTIGCSIISKPKFNLGESISVNGTCLTVISSGKTFFRTLASKETLEKTNIGLKKEGGSLNLERAMKASSRFGGHIVSGHVDNVGVITDTIEDGESIKYWIKFGKKYARYVIEKGSIAIDGISLTVNDTVKNKLSVNIIPHTDSKTNSNEWRVGDIVNLEFDMVAKYIEKMVVK